MVRGGAVCKTVGSAYVGSNPTPATTCENGPLTAETRPGGRFLRVTPCIRVFHCGSMRCGVHGRIADGVWAVRTVGAHRRLFRGRPRTGRVGVFRLDMRRRVGRASLCPPGGPVVPLGWAGKAGALDGQGGGPGELDGGLGRAAVCRCSTASWWRSRRISAVLPRRRTPGQPQPRGYLDGEKEHEAQAHETRSSMTGMPHCKSAAP